MLYGCVQQPQGGQPTPTATPEPEAGGVKKFSSYDELERFVGASGGAETYGSGAVRTMVSESVQKSAGAAAPDMNADYSRTNIQVEGVDEADIVKTDGKYAYAVSGGKIFIVNAYPAASAKVLSVIAMNASVSEIFVNKDRLVAFGSAYGVEILSAGGRSIPAVSELAMPYRPYYSTQRTFVNVYDISDKTSPSLARNISIDGGYFDSRMVGDYVYAITNQPIYGKPVPMPVISYGGTEERVLATDVYYFGVPDSAYAFTNVVSINVLDGATASKTFLMGQSQTLFASASNIYIVYPKRFGEIDYVNRIIDGVILPAVPQLGSRISDIRNSSADRGEKMRQIEEALGEHLRSLNPEQAAVLMRGMQEKLAVLQNELAKEMEKTLVHRIAINGGSVKYETNGEVPGRVLNQFSMDEYDGYFRIATTTGSGPEQGNHMYVLDSGLKIAGKIEDLASGERIYSVRFLGSKAYMVTFRQTDPLFVIDLSSPNAPKVLGYLKIPGVSDYLHPYDETHIIGVGRDATDEGRMRGLKIALFDVSDFANPKEMSKYIIGERGTDSEALRDHKAFLFSREKNLLVIPVSGYAFRAVPMIEKPNAMPAPSYWQGAYVFSIDLTNGINYRGNVTHGDAMRYNYASQIRRSLYIGDVLYTVSQRMIKMNGLADLAEINRVELETETPPLPPE